MAKLDGKVIIVTGGSKGIGLGCVEACVKHGARVALIARAATLEHVDGQTLALARDRILPLVADVRDAQQFEGAITAAVEHFGQLNGIVNNAGWHPPATAIENTSVDDFESLLRLNLTSTFLGCKLALPHLRTTAGAIVNMSSEVALVGQSLAPAYVASKAGQIGLTRALALDLAPDKIRVNAICPAGVMTPLMQEWAATLEDPMGAIAEVDRWHPLGRMATIEEIGEVCAFLLSPEAAFITGQAICPDGGASLGYRR